jgi:hypothetical protein
MAHWKTLVSNDYISSADLYDEKTEKFLELTVTIEKVQGGELTGDGGRKTRRPFVWFAGSKSGKPLALNSTNAKAVTAIAGSPDVKRWPGVPVTLFVTKTRDPNGEGMVDCIRIKAPSARADAARGDSAKDPRHG